MNIVSKNLSNLFESTVQVLYPDKKLKPLEISIATNEAFGDFQSNFALMNSKIIGDSPRNIAQKIKDNFPENPYVEKIEIAGPGFINIFLKGEYISDYILNIGEKYDFSFLETKGDVIIDFSSPNIAKRMHIGHLRSTIIGDSIARIYRYLGYNVVADNHIGDWGTQFGKLIIGYKNFLNLENYKKNPIEELERVYVEFSNRAENDLKLEDEARAELKKLQEGEEENTRLWKEFINASLNEYNKLYDRMDIHFDTYYGESFYHDMMPSVIEELESKKIAVNDEGAKVVFFDEKENLFPCIVQKKDGAFLYSTSDIATVKYRKDNYNVNKIIYVTDERQQDHFKQFFKITDMLGWNVEKHHIWFGIMRFSDGIFSTRKGNVIRLEELLDEAKRRAYAIVDEKNSELSEDKKEKIAEVVGVSSVKYADLSQNRQSPVIFEWDKILSFDGNTAPYLLYSYARIQSILAKIKERNLDINSVKRIVLDNKYEKSLATQLLYFPLEILKAAETFKPNTIADYLYELAKKLNSFYNNCPILNQEEEVLLMRAKIIEKTAEVLKEGLNLLGIKTLEKM